MTNPEIRRSECPDAGQLAAFADGALSSAERQHIESHVAACEDCYEALVGIAAITAALTAPTAPAVPDPAPRSQMRRTILWIGGTLATAAALFLVANLWLSTRPDALEVALSDLTHARRDAGRGIARLSLDGAWAPPSAVLRSGNAETLDPFSVQTAVQTLKVAANQDYSQRGRHFLGLALAASRDYNAATDALNQALQQSGGSKEDEAEIRADLAGVWLERHRNSGNPADAERALDETDRALSSVPQHLQATFNRALALDALGRPAARQAWQAYIDLDRNPSAGWVAEATRRRDR
jgi:anti-sigma factor RsiW